MVNHYQNSYFEQAEDKAICLRSRSAIPKKYHRSEEAGKERQKVTYNFRIINLQTQNIKLTYSQTHNLGLNATQTQSSRMNDY